MPAVTLNVNIKGPLFSRSIKSVVERQIAVEIFDKLGQRAERGGKGEGARVNTIRRQRPRSTELIITSTRIWPRTKGTAWTRKNVAILKSMAPRVARKAAERIAAELS